MAIMYPQNIYEYNPTRSEEIVYEKLKNQLPDSYSVFYSVQWSQNIRGRMTKSEADFIVTHPNYGYVCLEVKGGSHIRIENGVWYVSDEQYGERSLKRSPYDQAEESMYYFRNQYSKAYHIKYSGIYAAAAVFPFFNKNSLVDISNRENQLTIDAMDLDKIESSLISIFKEWSNGKFGRILYKKDDHVALNELIKKKLSISAAAGVLVKYKEKQFKIINRVQDNYIYLLKNINKFYIRGGAGTGKTWIVMKMALNDSLNSKKVLIVCYSPALCKWIERELNNKKIEVKTVFEVVKLNEDYKYDSIYVDEAQDFDYTNSQLVLSHLVDRETSRLGVFYDDVQKIEQNQNDNLFNISTPPFLLRENIRNTLNIYDWAMKKTDLGRDVILNPVEGPTPIYENVRDSSNLIQRLESILKEFIIDENLNSTSIVILTEDIDDFFKKYGDKIAIWNFVTNRSVNQNDILISNVIDFKGLESDVVIYIHGINSSDNINYIAYTRAKYYLYELVID